MLKQLYFFSAKMVLQYALCSPECELQTSQLYEEQHRHNHEHTGCELWSKFIETTWGNMRKRNTQREKKQYCNNYFHHIFLEGTWTFVGEVRGHILGDADVGICNLSASPDVPPLSRWASSKLNINVSGSPVIPFAKQHLWLQQCFPVPLPREISLCMNFTAKLLSLSLRNSVLL